MNNEAFARVKIDALLASGCYPTRAFIRES